jgi:ubiquinone/menaquinone biosynthesis C-methylase UbiE
MDKRLTFNQAPSLYDSIRPVYVDELYKNIFDYSNIAEKSKALEIGIGTGQATLPCLEANLEVTAIELGEDLAAFSKDKYKAYPSFKVVNFDFMDYECADSSYDLIYSATAFHWLPEKEGYEKVFRMLKSGGTFARFRNHPYRDKGNEQLNKDIEKLYEEYMPRTRQKMPKEFNIDDANKLSDISKNYGFISQDCKLYNRIRTLNSVEYSNLLKTYSDHIALGEAKLNEFTTRIKDTIDINGGVINIYDTIDLQLAKKP